MKRLGWPWLKVGLGSGCAIAIVLTALVVQAGSWDNFKLRYFSLTQHLNDPGLIYWKKENKAGIS